MTELPKEESLCKYLSHDQFENFKELTIPELEVKLAEALQLNDYDTSLESGIILDYYVSAFCFGRKHNFDTNETDCLMLMMQLCFENCKAGLPWEDNAMTLKEQLKEITDKADEITPPKLELKRGLLIFDYLLRSLFQHYKLYQVLFTTKQTTAVINEQLKVELLPPASLPFPAPLEEGMPKELYERFIEPPSEILAINEGDQEDQSRSIENQVLNQLANQGDEKSNILESIPPEQIRELVNSMTAQKLEEIKAEYKRRLKEKESVLLSKLSRLNVK